MKVLSIATICESLGAPAGEKRASGNVQNFEKFFRPETLERLDATHAGAFAFLAFHPVSDVHVAKYVLEGTLPSDTGSDLLVLFTVDKAARFPVNVKDVVMVDGVEVDTAEHASYKLARLVFPTKVIDGFPGIVLFPRMTGLVEPVYVRLSTKRVRQDMQRLSALCGEALRAPHIAFADAVAPKLARESFTYLRGGATSTSEWLYKALGFLRPYKKDIATAALKVASAGVFGKEAEAPKDESE